MKLIDVSGNDIEEVKAAINSQVRAISGYELLATRNDAFTNELYRLAEMSITFFGSVQITVGTEE